MRDIQHLMEIIGVMDIELWATHHKELRHYLETCPDESFEFYWAIASKPGIYQSDFNVFLQRLRKELLGE